MKRVKFRELPMEDKSEIASIAAAFARCQIDINRTNEEFKELLERKKRIDDRINEARNRYEQLVSSMSARIGGKFEIEIDEEMPEQIRSMMNIS